MAGYLSSVNLTGRLVSAGSNERFNSVRTIARIFSPPEKDILLPFCVSPPCPLWYPPASFPLDASHPPEYSPFVAPLGYPQPEQTLSLLAKKKD